MTPTAAQSTRTSVLATVGSIAFGLVLGVATLRLHGMAPGLDEATNSTTTWIIWAAIAGALIPNRSLATMCGALILVATCTGYYAAAAARHIFDMGAIPTAAVWFVTGAIGGPILAWAGWNTRRATGLQRHLGVAIIGMAITGEGLWLAAVLHHWATAAVFLAAGVITTTALTIYRYKAAGPRSWQPLIYMPILAAAYLATEYFVLDRLLTAL
ncbi:MAG TPA: DUF6518 family protein [Pseudonocardiaceae bacterium]|nr:DUF6518 family protein [Pseudonocardiaceae bacterium]